MILAGYILKDKKVFSNFLAPLSLKQKTTLNRLKKFRPSKRLLEAELDTNVIFPLEESPKNYLLGWVGSSSKSTPSKCNGTLYAGMAVYSHRFMLYNSEFVVVLITRPDTLLSENLTSTEASPKSNDVKIQIDSQSKPLLTRNSNSDSFESLKSSPENPLKSSEQPLVLESLSDFQDDPLASQAPTESTPESQSRAERETGAQNEEKLGEAVEEIKSEIVKHFFVHLERGDAGLFFSRFLHRVLVKGGPE